MTTFADIREPLDQLVRRIVWCTVTTIDRKNRPRARMLHPVWELQGDRPVGWIMTGRQSHKAKHIQHNPFVSLSYWDQQHQQAMLECKASWADAAAEKQRIWDLFKSLPEPYGYDAKTFWSAPSDASFGALRLDPWRVELWSLQAMAQGKPPTLWRAST